MKTKRKYVLLLMLIAGFFLTFGVGKVSADTCSSQNAGFACVDTSKVEGTSGCKTNLCGGTANVQCCSLVNVKCKKDGSSLMQPCSATGLCNQLGDCIDVPKGTATPTSGSTASSTNFTNPLKFDTVEAFLNTIMSAIQKIIVLLALVFMMIGSVMILASAGNSGMVEQGKKSITMALVGFALGVAAPSLLKELAGIIGWGVDAPAVASALTLTEIAVKVLNFLLGTMGIMALVMMVIGAIMYLSAGVDEDLVKKGKDIFKYSLIGVIMAMVSMVLLTQIAAFFR